MHTDVLTVEKIEGGPRPLNEELPRHLREECWNCGECIPIDLHFSDGNVVEYRGTCTKCECECTVWPEWDPS